MSKPRGMIVALVAAGALVGLEQRGLADTEQTETEPAKAIDAAPAEPMKRQGIFVNPLGLLFGALGAEYAVALSDKTALAITPAFAYASASADGSTVSATGADLAVGVQLFPADRVFKRIYVYPFVNAGYLSISGNGESASAVLVGGGAIVGYQWTWSGGFSLRLGGGAGYAQAVVTDGETSLNVSGVGPRLDGVLGYAW
jgi:hypothetical protein